MTALIILMLGFFAVIGIRWYAVRMQHGDDKLTLNTAISVAKVDSLDGQRCPVDGCSGGRCLHRRSDGSYVGYYDNVKNTIVGDKPKGYNEYTTMRIGHNTYRGARGTMIIRVKTKSGRITMSWVSGA